MSRTPTLIFFHKRIPKFRCFVEVLDGGGHLIVAFEGRSVAVRESDGGVVDLDRDASRPARSGEPIKHAGIVKCLATCSGMARHCEKPGDLLIIQDAEHRLRHPLVLQEHRAAQLRWLLKMQEHTQVVQVLAQVERLVVV